MEASVLYGQACGAHRDRGVQRGEGRRIDECHEEHATSVKYAFFFGRHVNTSGETFLILSRCKSVVRARAANASTTLHDLHKDGFRRLLSFGRCHRTGAEAIRRLDVREESSMSNPNSQVHPPRASLLPTPTMVKLSALPTLRQVYASGLSISPSPRYKCLPKALDLLTIWKGDITELESDAIVNAANKSLLGGGGVDGAIHRAAGDELYEECKSLGGANTGEAKITRAYALPSKHVIHAVGPVYVKGKEDEKAQQLASCYSASFALAVQNQCKSIGFPSISTGIYGYPMADATHIALDMTRKFLEGPEGAMMERVVFVVFSEKDKAVYEDLVSVYFPPEESKE
ncbi:A1pp-domain-containing protein [Calocera viscosa TUFC12733]|uniref:A1pp-domain-containing protein n=1 Tax=Calocera viscosa (strain TUFC12733) TaxID=1330018 RepID=A0A167QX21_CALVF|nr:A1pp-domain-containing protein [Calocera viscosa TUFC12733]